MATRKELIRGFLPLVAGILLIVLVTTVFPTAVKYISRASGEPADLVYNYEGVLGVVPTLWRNLAQGGEEKKRYVG